jgi:hypothetical protein
VKNGQKFFLTLLQNAAGFSKVISTQQQRVLIMPKNCVSMVYDMHAEEEWYGLTSTT